MREYIHTYIDRYTDTYIRIYLLTYTDTQSLEQHVYAFGRVLGSLSATEPFRLTISIIFLWTLRSPRHK